MQISVLPSGLLLTTNYDPLQAIVDEEEDLALSEAQAVLASGNVVQLLEANATDSTSVRLLWEVSKRGLTTVQRQLAVNLVATLEHDP